MQKSVEHLMAFLGLLKIHSVDDWFSAHQLAHGFTHRLTGITAYVEENPDEQRLKITEGNARTGLD